MYRKIKFCIECRLHLRFNNSNFQAKGQTLYMIAPDEETKKLQDLRIIFDSVQGFEISRLQVYKA